MSNQYAGGFMSKTPPIVTQSSAKGIWTLSQQAQYQKAGVWPMFIPNYINTFSDTTAYDNLQSVITDSSNNVYIAGHSNLQANGQGSFLYASLLIKFNSKGEQQWQKTTMLDSIGKDINVNGMCLDSSGNIFITGVCGAGGDVGAMFITKYDSSGTFQWSYSLNFNNGSSIYDYSSSIVSDSSGNVYMCGTQIGGTTSNLVLAKYNGSGTYQWQKIMIGSGSDVGNGVALDSSGNIYTAGLTTSYNSNTCALIIKYNSSSSVLWQKVVYWSSYSISFNDIIIDKTDNIYCCGTYNNGSIPTMLLIKYNTDGVIQWQRQLGNNNEQGQKLSLDSDGNIYVNGYVSFGSYYGFLIAKYNSSGIIQWQRTLSAGSGHNMFGYGINIDATGTMHLVGTVAKSGGGGNSILLTLPSNGSNTGSYTITGITYTYAASVLSESDVTISTTSVSLSETTTNMTNAQVTGLALNSFGVSTTYTSI